MHKCPTCPEKEALSMLFVKMEMVAGREALGSANLLRFMSSKNASHQRKCVVGRRMVMGREKREHGRSREGGQSTEEARRE